VFIAPDKGTKSRPVRSQSTHSSVEAGQRRWSEGVQEDGCVMSKPRERNTEPVKVPFAATPAGEPSSPRDWANRCVWTDRMLRTLEQGVRGGRWHTLIDKVYASRNLFAASGKVIGNGGAAGVDHQTVEGFLARRREELARLHETLRRDSYRPQAIQRVWIPKPGSSEQRPLGVPTVRDRVVQTALLHVLEPIFDDTFSEFSYGFRHGRGCHHALERVEELLDAGYVYVVDADLKSYFDTIPKSRLMARVREKVSDSRVLRLVERFLEQGVMDGWIRGRLRSILRKRSGRRGRARGKDHQRWPNRFFDEQGLYSLRAAYVRFAQSSRR